jgi:hypothetical protein
MNDDSGKLAPIDDSSKEPLIPHPIYNWMSAIGSAIAVISATIAIFLVLIGLLSGDVSGYSGLLLLFPFTSGAIGVGLAIAGYWRELGRRKRGRHSSFVELTVVDPFYFVRRTGVAAVLAGLVVATFALMTAGAGSLAVVEYSESNAFCGEMCHQVMGPEYTTYHDSPHARIDCVECHVGPGGSSYLEAKIGGMRQLWSLATDQVNRPIPTPVHGLRSGDEMCGSCHNRERFVGYKAVTRTYHPSGDSENPVKLGMLMKVGGGDGGLMKGGGIHYHMLLAHEVEFIARDPQRQEIAWVRVVHDDGEVIEYTHEDAPLSDDERRSLPVRQMECLDCHSRPAHKFQSPVRSVDHALASGAILASIPSIKEAAVRALDGDYATTGQALAGIPVALEDFYEEEDEDVLESHPEDLAQATEVLRDIYQRTLFPEMKADWRSHPDNSGHLESPGCFRCHNDSMLDAEGEPLVNDCQICHTVLAQDESTIRTIEDLDVGRRFVHPEDGEPFEEFSLCSDCHTGGAALYD